MSDRQTDSERPTMIKLEPAANDNGAAGFCILYAGGPSNEVLELATVTPRDEGLLAVVWEELARVSVAHKRDDLMAERFDRQGVVVEDMCVSLQAVERLARRPLAALLRTAVPRDPATIDPKGG